MRLGASWPVAARQRLKADCVSKGTLILGLEALWGFRRHPIASKRLNEQGHAFGVHSPKSPASGDWSSGMKRQGSRDPAWDGSSHGAKSFEMETVSVKGARQFVLRALPAFSWKLLRRLK